MPEPARRLPRRKADARNVRYGGEADVSVRLVCRQLPCSLWAHGWAAGGEKMRFSVLLVLAITVAIAACKPTVRLPLERGVIQLCAADNQIIAKVSQEAARHGLKYRYSTHQTYYGRQMFFLLIGEGFEIELWNAFARQNYELRVYNMKSDRADDDQAVSAYSSFANALTTDPVLACEATEVQSASEAFPK